MMKPGKMLIFIEMLTRILIQTTKESVLCCAVFIASIEYLIKPGKDDIPRIDLSEMMEMVDLNKKDIEMEDNE